MILAMDHVFHVVYVWPGTIMLLPYYSEQEIRETVVMCTSSTLPFC
jgi:hypothetical protein